jgi:hypothetical protein
MERFVLGLKHLPQNTAFIPRLLVEPEGFL